MNMIVQAKEVSKVFTTGKINQEKVLDQINFSIAEGEFVSIMGPSGSGKSTLLYQISGLDQATTGTIVFQQKNLVGLQEKKLSALRLHDMGFIFQQHYLLKNLSLFENIVVPAYFAKKVSRSQINTKAVDLMEKLGIEKVQHHDITQVSGGQLQRAAICRALINNPAIIFADEPTGALNTAAANDVLAILKQINQAGTTILLVTHDVKVAAQSDRVLYMLDGRLVGEKRLNSNNPSSAVTNEKMLSEWLMERHF